jgi:hypothetical protein
VIHLSVFVEPYLQWVLDGTKVIESRFSVNKCAPFEKIKKGDIILVKKSGGPIVAIAQAGTIWSYNLEASSWKEIKKTFTQALCAQDPKFWENRSSATYATLIKLENVISINPIFFPKKDRRGWVILNSKNQIALKF